MVDKIVDELKDILLKEVPLCTGVVRLNANNSQLFYRNAADGSLGYTNFDPLLFHKDAILTLFISLALSISLPSATTSWTNSLRLVNQQLLVSNNRMFWMNHIAKLGKWTLSTFLPTSILAILVSWKVYVAYSLKILNRQFKSSCTSWMFMVCRNFHFGFPGLSLTSDCRSWVVF